MTVAAEQAAGHVLPRAYCFSWLAQKEVVADGDVADRVRAEISDLYPLIPDPEYKKPS